MKAYLIDPFDQTVTEVEHNGDYRQIYDLIQARPFTAAYPWESSDTVYVDDEGLYRDNQAFFWIDGYPQPLAGRGLVLGTDEEGDSASPLMTLDELKKQVAWVSYVRINGVAGFVEHGRAA